MTQESVQDHRASTSLPAGILTSLLVHAGLAGGLAVFGDALGKGAEAQNQGMLIPLDEINPDDPLQKARPVRPEDQEEEVKLGIADGVTQTETWLGFKDATPHSATPGTIDQAAFTIASGPISEMKVGGEDAAPSNARDAQAAVSPPTEASPVAPETHAQEPAKESQPQPVAAAPETLPPEVVSPQPTPPPTAPPISALNPQGTQDKPDDSTVPPEVDAKVSDAAGDAKEKREGQDTKENDALREDQAPAPEKFEQESPPRDAVPEPQDRPDPTTPSEQTKAQEAARTPPAEQPPTTTDATPRPPREAIPGSAPKITGTRPGASGRPGERTDQSSDATSTMRDVIDVVPGRPAAAKGLKIKTTPPQWGVTTSLMSAARNPVVSITFGRSGKVIRAGFVKGQNAGSLEVDGPLLDAIHEWVAEGERLKSIPDRPDAGVTIRMRIILRGF